MRKLAVVLAVLLLLGSTVAACWLVNVWHESKEQDVKIVELRKLTAKKPATDLKGGLKSVTKPSAASQSSGKSHGKSTLHDFAVLKEKNPDCVDWVIYPWHIHRLSGHAEQRFLPQT